MVSGFGLLSDGSLKLSQSHALSTLFDFVFSNAGAKRAFTPNPKENGGRAPAAGVECVKFSRAAREIHASSRPPAPKCHLQPRAHRKH